MNKIKIIKKPINDSVKYKSSVGLKIYIDNKYYGAWMPLKKSVKQLQKISDFNLFKSLCPFLEEMKEGVVPDPIYPL